MNIRNMFKDIFKPKENKPKYKYLNAYTMLNNSSSAFYNWNGKIYDNNIARTAIGTNGINAAKLNPKHIRILKNDIEVSPNTNISRILKTPNQFMTMFDFLQKMMIQREENNMEAMRQKIADPTPGSAIFLCVFGALL